MRSAVRANRTIAAGDRPGVVGLKARRTRRRYQPPYHRRVGRLAAALPVGVAAGFIGGLFGVGGGLVYVPAMVLLLGVAQHTAHGTSVAAIVAAATAAVIPFASDGAVDWAAAGTLFVGASVGAVVGVRLIGKMSEIWLARSFVALLFVAAGRLLVGS